MATAWYLTFVEGTHNKFYAIHVLSDGSTVMVWGRIGAKAQGKVAPCSPEDGVELALHQLHMKMAKGYQLQVDGVEWDDTGEPFGDWSWYADKAASLKGVMPVPPVEAAVAAPRRTIAPQLATSLDMSDVGRYVLDGDWIMEQKLDGHRLLVVSTGSGFTFLTRNGTEYTKAVPDLGRLRLPDGLAVDCELVDGVLWAFDLVTMDGALNSMPLRERRALLVDVPTPIQIVPQASTLAEKEWLLIEAARMGLEGVMVKRASSAYEPGQRSLDWLKVKFTSTVDVIVLAVRDDGKESASLGLFDGNRIIEVGRCSLIGKPPVVPGDVVEVKYLYAVHPERPRLTQPTLLRVRTDKQPLECDTSQLRFTHKKVIKEFV